MGGGFAGIKAALELGDQEHFAVTLLSDQPAMRFYPTLYHAAVGGRRANVSIPLSELLR